ncbi:four-carbon acid sugar kinase family protein [Rhodopirellula sp. P2]|uniref:four-carbon acid sugar kinase family protein n=1 Tax=Rhodopirellula sp. P2 TaxID=2127060 RepID=UPI0023685D4D|nr:four-carbon acid sugar kinase family protein [Rhodopirellula sp. P2]WDQ15249.1 four-carbon acid sugar kinase family protein [Rhodopirellula sp. P2]
MTKTLSDALQGVAEERPESLLPKIRENNQRSNRKIVVLDDDPTGTQTVYDTPVLTTWGVDELAAALKSPADLFYVLTNSRSLTEPDAVRLAEEIGKNLTEAARQAQQGFVVVSRSDSTLRGHYPAEVDAIASAVGTTDAVHVIAPFFLQGGRFTIGDVHYVAEEDRLIPAAETPFAKDAAFGFQNSDLKRWVAEKHHGKLEASQIVSVGLNELRSSDLTPLQSRLAELPPGSVCIVNAVSMRDIEAFVFAAQSAEQQGQTFVYRTAASFVQAFAGLEPRDLLRANEMVDEGSQTGLVVVGSYVPKTTEQLKCLLDSESNLTSIVMDVDRLLEDESDSYLQEIVTAVNDGLQQSNVVLSSSRKLVTGTDAAASLAIGNQVSKALVSVVGSLTQRPRFLIAKGGITSSDVATKGLRAKHALVLGQILPGVPVWKMPADSHLPGIAYVVFPGNVGGPNALLEAFQKLKA